jgi:tetratricopeptide (TPR) repeat protein
MTSISTTGEGLNSLLKHDGNHLEILRYIRSHRLGEPDLVLKHGKALVGKQLTAKAKPVSSGGSTTSPIVTVVSNTLLAMLGLTLSASETLSIFEQMLRAALDVTPKQHDFADTIYSHIVAKVNNPASARVRCLLGLCLESSGDFEGAATIYEELLKDNPANLMALKRQYCLLRVQGGGDGKKEVVEANALAMEALNRCLKEGNPSDAPTWYEMAQLCQSVGDIRGAVFCHEELVLMDPLNANLHCILGELYAKLGGLSNLKYARKHLAQSLELSSPHTHNGNNVQALQSLLDVASTFVSQATAVLQKRSNDNNNKKRQNVQHEETVDEDDVEVAKALVRYSAAGLLAHYKGTSDFSKIESMVNERLAALE